MFALFSRTRFGGACIRVLESTGLTSTVLTSTVLASAVLAPAVLAPAAFATSGVLVHQTSVYQLDGIGTDAFEIATVLELEHAVLAAAPLGDVWLGSAFDQLPSPNMSLVRFDAATGAKIGSTPFTFGGDVDGDIEVWEMEPRGDGSFWVLAFLTVSVPDTTVFFLGTLDPATAQVDQVVQVDPAPDVLALFEDGGELFTGLRNGSIARLDVGTGALEVVGTPEGSRCLLAGEFAVDDGGVLHTIVNPDPCNPLPPQGPRQLASHLWPSTLDDDAVFPQVRIELLGLEGQISYFDVGGSVSVVDVPTLDTAGLATLIGLLGLGGVLLIRRGLQE